jgi:hypothetical protein
MVKDRIWQVGMLIGLFGAFMAGVGVTQSNAAKVVRAERFELVNASGKSLIQLMPTPDGQGGLITFRNQANQPALTLSVVSDMPSIALRNDQSACGVTLVVAKDGSSAMVLQDKTGKTRGTVDMKADGTPTMAICHPDGKTAVGITTADDGTANIVMRNASGELKKVAPDIEK